MNKGSVKKLFSFLLATLMLLSAVPFNLLNEVMHVHAEEATETELPVDFHEYDYDSLVITLNDQEIDELEIFDYEKVEITAKGIDDAAEYQWQIEHPENDNSWVDIYDEVSKSIDVSLALIKNVLRDNGTVRIRCAAVFEDTNYISEPVVVSVKNEVVEPSAVFSVYKNNGGIMLANNSKAAASEFVTVTIEYVQYDFERDAYGNLVKDGAGNNVLDEGKQAFTSYMATIKSGSDLNTTVHFPTMVGYDSFFVNSDSTETKMTSYTINLTNVTDNIVYTVKYKPAKVDYTVRYYLQNIYDDLYVEDINLKVDAKGFTGDVPPDTYVEKIIPGFTALYHQPDAIAADGSTVFSVYYERDYYLMEFDCNGGYGTETLYLRYGSYINVPAPQKMGHVFLYWNIVSKKEGNVDTNLENATQGTEDVLPATMPHYHSAYKAVWGNTDTTYSVVYWIDNGDGTKTYIGDRIVDSTSGSVVSGSDDLFYKCGILEHQHISTCLNCNHTHSVSDCLATQYGSLENERNYTNAINDSQLEVIQNGYVYEFYYVNWRGESTKNYFVYLNNKWVKIQSGQIGEIVADGCGEYKLNNNTTYYANMYEIDYSMCDHTHNESCYQCGIAVHVHDDSCKRADAPTVGRHVLFLNADQNIIVEGDGSTTVNVYYTYKTYTIRFIYAKKGNNNNYLLASLTQGGALEGENACTWNFSVASLPSFTDPSGKTTVSSFTDSGNTYYYISLKAKYGADISKLWPAANIGNIGNYYWGSWAAAPDTGYREKDESHANIVGVYPVMSDEMIVPNPTLLDDGSYLAQDMPAWWAQSSDNVSNHAYHNYFEVLTPPSQEITSFDTPVTIDGKTYIKHMSGDTAKIYVLENMMFTCAHNGSTRVDAVQFAGFKTINENSIEQANSNNYKNDGDCPICGNECNYCTIYFYDRIRYVLDFGNFNDISVAPDDKNIAFGDSLSHLNPGEPEYPKGLEPNAYEFKGWYSTPECYDGTEVDWDNLKMGDGNITFYAKWSPIMRNVVFYSAYSDIEADKNDITSKQYHFLKAEDVPHGTNLGSSYYVLPEWPGDIDPTITNPTIAEQYDFVGWFYMDEDNKKRFAPDSMEVTRDLVLFAEWNTSIDTTYEIKYVLRDDVSGENTPSHTDYKAGDLVGETINAHSSVGKTKTFAAKGLGELYPDFQKKFFPTVNTHSILMDIESAKNNFTFEYVYDDTVFYKVRYVDYSTKVEIATSKVASTDNSIVTEKFKPIQGYIPQSYYIRKTLAYDGNANENSVIDDNIITFYYVKDDKHGLYSIEYYLEKPNSGYDSNHKDFNGIPDGADPDYFEQFFTQSESIVGSDDLNKVITAEVRNTYVGYTYQPGLNMVITYNKDGTKKETKVGSDAGNPPKGTLDYTGLTIKLFYTRNEYPYVIEYREHGSDESAPPLKVIDKQSNGIDVADMAEFDTVISHTGDASFELAGIPYDYYIDDSTEQQRTREMTIRHFEGATNPNKLIFYYKKHEVTVIYHSVCSEGDVDDFGSVSIYSERSSTVSGLSGSTAQPGKGFKFVGWYSDPECESLVSNSVFYKPTVLNLNEDEVHYYALFEPIASNIEIQKAVLGLPANINNDDYFLFHVKGMGKNDYIDFIVSISGSGKLTLNNLPIGDYEITELIDWSWKYSNAQWNYSADAVDANTLGSTALITVTTSGGTIVFENTYANPDWLGGEHSEDNTFQ